MIYFFQLLYVNIMKNINEENMFTLYKIHGW